ncbi:MAG: large conductance mechanosensitive channel protein MscL [Thermoplasmata archaeon]|nr:large conductance mechanosensitive channel protein MscL [Thermoplasmata archaeon]
MGVVEEFKTFLSQGNVIQLAVAFIIGAAFTAVVTAFVTDIVTPLIGIPGNADFSGENFTVGHSIFHVGLFVNAVIAFVLIALVVFFAIVRPVAKVEERRKARLAAAPPTTRACPQCLATVPILAQRCQFCTQPLPAVTS